MAIRALGFALLVLAATTARADVATVEAVQYPAWLERGGASVPLTPGTRLQARDRLRTGGNARVRVRMGEGSAVKLGENARFEIEVAEDRNVFRAALSVVAGAFRFTTNPLSKRSRDLSIRAKSVTAGIRGTDVWGKSTDERDLVCLLEGRITVGAAGHSPVTLERPLDFYQKPRDAAPSIARVDAQQLEAWARETELSPDGAGASAEGRWRMVAAVKPHRDAALALARRLRAAGYPAEIVQNENYFSVQVARLAGEREARALMSAVRSIQGVDLPSVHEGPL
jgi:hypothetical protein